MFWLSLGYASISLNQCLSSWCHHFTAKQVGVFSLHTGKVHEQFQLSFEKKCCQSWSDRRDRWGLMEKTWFSVRDASASNWCSEQSQKSVSDVPTKKRPSNNYFREVLKIFRRCAPWVLSPVTLKSTNFAWKTRIILPEGSSNRGPRRIPNVT